ncbi:MAG: hypothetical protein NTX97_01935 [Bacteroidetes bacterium]|nr:hypothetical protein [Bacteroidota bacterium]
MSSWWEIILVFLLSTIKFFFGGVPTALGFGFSYFESITVTTLGGFTGVVVFVFASDKLILFFKKKAELKRANNLVRTPKKKFTRTNRIIINVKRRFGLLGFTLLVPFLIPIPIGCFLAVRYFNDKQKIIRYLFLSIFIWSVIGTLLYKPVFDAIRNYFL